MGESTSEDREYGNGIDTHNAVMHKIRAERTETNDPHEPTQVWLDEDNTPDGVYRSLTIILNTGGGRRARAGGCSMYGHVAESVKDDSVGHEALLDQLEIALDHEQEHADTPAGLVKIYTLGSFLDNREVPAETRRNIADTFSDRDRIVVESLPEFVTRDKIREFADHGLVTDIAVGLETATDRVRRDCVNTYFDFSDFKEACAEATAAASLSDGDAGVKAYLLMKPPFLAEPEAAGDIIDSVRQCANVDGCHTVSVTPCTVHRHTMVDELFHEGGYRPPWLWSVADMLEETASVDALVVSAPAGHGSERGAHNCGDCDSRVQKAIKDFNLRQDPTVFEQVSCECERTWELVMEEETAYNQPLIS